MDVQDPVKSLVLSKLLFQFWSVLSFLHGSRCLISNYTCVSHLHLIAALHLCTPHVLFVVLDYYSFMYDCLKVRADSSSVVPELRRKAFRFEHL